MIDAMHMIAGIFDDLDTTRITLRSRELQNFKPEPLAVSPQADGTQTPEEYGAVRFIIGELMEQKTFALGSSC